MIKTYKKESQRLRVTGGGLGDENTDNEHLEFYIPPDGPSVDTPAVAQNLWRK